jgi:F-type H+-transporting ATPase subunit c
MSTKSKLAVASATLVTAFASTALAQQAAGAAGAAAGGDARYTAAALAAGLAIGMAALGGTLGQGRATAAALEGISRNPGAASRIQTPMILGLALIESLVLFAWVIAFMLQMKF